MKCRAFVIVVMFSLIVSSVFSLEGTVIKKTQIFSQLRDATGVYLDVGTSVTLNIVDIELIENKEDLKNLPWSYCVKVKTKDAQEGYIQLNDIARNSESIMSPDLSSFLWSPAYEIDVIFANNPKKIEEYVNFYKEYDSWKKHTDWENDTWYSVYNSPAFIFTNMVFLINDLNCFGGKVSGFIKDFNSTEKKIVWQCVQSGFDDYVYDYGYVLPDFITNQFEPQKTYIFNYELDGDYLNIYLDDKLLFQLTKIDRITKMEFNNFLKDLEEFNPSNITWPRHADGSCDYDNKRIVTVQQDSRYRTVDNLRLRSAEQTSSNVLTTLEKGTIVTVLSLGKEDTIDGIQSHWVKVQLEDGTKGWCFGGYLSTTPIEVPSSYKSNQTKGSNQNTATTTKIFAGVTNSMLIVGGGVLVLLLGAGIFLLLKRKK